MLQNLMNGLRVILGKQQKKKKPGGRRKKTVASILTDTFIKALERNDRLRDEVTFKHFGYDDILVKNNPVNRKREELLLVALERAKEIINNNPALVNHFSVKLIFDVLGLDPPPELTKAPQPPLTAAEKNAKKTEGLSQLLEQIRVLKEITAEIEGDGSKGSGISKLITPEVLIQLLSMISALIAARQPGNGSQSSGQRISVETPDGIVEMSVLEYQSYLAKKISTGHKTPELDPIIGSQALPGTPGNVKGEQQRRQLAEAEEVSNHMSLRITELVAWVDKKPVEFIEYLTALTLKGDVEAKAALDFLRHYSLQEAVIFLEARKGSSDDPAVESAIITLLEHQDWLQAVIDQIRRQTGALGHEQE